MEEIKLTTEDKVNIYGTFFPAESKKGVILLHMLGWTRQTWKGFTPILQQQNYNVLIIDLRGHGQSTEENMNYKEFSGKEFNAMVKDVKAAKVFLQTKGNEEIHVIGASIGANLALNYAAGDEDIKSIILLSPGLNYKEIKTEETIKKYTRPLLLVASEEDEYSAASAKQLHNLSPSERKELKMYNNADHGTRMFANEPTLKETILKFLQQ